MKNYCGANCEICGFKENCHGCIETCGKPFGGTCIAAEYIKVGGKSNFDEFKKQIISEFNSLNVDGMPKITELYCLAGSYVNLAYPMPSGNNIKLLDDKNIYLGAQVEHKCIDRCFGVVAGMDFLLVCEYGEGGTNPELIAYVKR